MTEVELCTLSKRYDENGKSAVDNLSLAIAPSGITALLGPSGCGKTTTLKLIAGLLKPTAGDILFDGQSVLAIPADRRGAVMVFQNHLLFPHLSAADNVAFGLRMAGVDRATRRRKAAAMLDLVQLTGYGNRRPNELSGGQQQRVALARALIVEPRVLLLDEPLSNLDAYLRDEMRQLILRIQREMQVTTIVVTHDQEEAVILADTIALMFDGAIAQIGTPQTFYERPAGERVARFFGGSNFISGTWCASRVKTALGLLRVAAGAPIGTDGTPALLTIRPEQIIPPTAADDTNVVAVQVIETIYGGTYARIRFATGDEAQQLEMLGAAALATVCKPGDRVNVCLPPDRLWPVA